VKPQHPLLLAGVFPPDIGGPAIFAETLMQELPVRRVSPSLLCFSPFRKYPRGLRHALFLCRILAERRSFQVLFALDPISVGLPALIASKLLRRPFMLRIGGDFAWEQATERFGVESDLDQFLGMHWNPRTRMLVWLERWVARQARFIITPSQYMRRVLLRWGVREEHIVVIANGVRPVDPASSHDQARTRLGIAGQLIVSVGRLMRFKGFGEFIEAAAELIPAFPSLSLIIIGSGPRQSEITTRIHELGLADRIRLLGSLPHEKTLQYLQAADLFVLNSSTEGQSHAILEAMAAGTPVLTTRTGGNLELIEHGRSGWLVEPNNREALAEGMSVLLRDTRQANALAAMAKETADKYNVAKMVDQVVATLEETL
jgi:glycosyltransferase involved in cell wall biosynthesis